jgi:hypothetical protein
MSDEKITVPREVSASVIARLEAMGVDAAVPPTETDTSGNQADPQGTQGAPPATDAAATETPAQTAPAAQQTEPSRGAAGGTPEDDDFFEAEAPATPPAQTTPTAAAPDFSQVFSELGVKDADEAKRLIARAKEVEQSPISDVAMNVARMFDAAEGDFDKLTTMFKSLKPVDYEKVQAEDLFYNYLRRTTRNLTDDELNELYDEQYAGLQGAKLKLAQQDIIEKMQAMDTTDRQKVQEAFKPSMEKVQQQEEAYKMAREFQQRTAQQANQFITSAEAIGGVKLTAKAKEYIANQVTPFFQDDTYLSRIFFDPETKQMNVEAIMDAYLTYSPVIEEKYRKQYIERKNAKLKEQATAQAYIERAHIGEKPNNANQAKVSALTDKQRKEKFERDYAEGKVKLKESDIKIIG